MELRAYYNRASGPPLASRMSARVRAALAGIAADPHVGSRREEFGDNVRVCFVRPYAIYFETFTDRVVVLRILHQSRDRDAIMRGVQEETAPFAAGV